MGGGKWSIRYLHLTSILPVVVKGVTGNKEGIRQGLCS